MSLLTSPINFLVRRLLRFISRIEHARTHLRVLRRGALDKEAARKARESWWGDDPRWYAGGTPPRQHNRVTPLIDGAAYFAALRKALDEAQHYVYIIGWCLTPRIPLERATQQDLVDAQLLTILSKTAQRVPVRILLWNGASFLIEPTTRRVHKVKSIIEKETQGDILCRLDPTAHPTHCHHQKAIVVDGRLAFIGGMDLTTFSGDRWDTPYHPLRAAQNWHDVQLLIEGEAVADVEQNFRQRWDAVTRRNRGKRDTLPPRVDPQNSQDPSSFVPSLRSGQALRPSSLVGHLAPVQIVRTIPSHVYRFARHGEFGIFHAYMQAIRRAKRFIYIENQYIWSPHVMDALLAALNAPHEEPFRIILVLPAFASDGRWDNDKHVQRLRKEDKGRGIVSIYTLYTSGPNAGEKPFTYRAIYLHAKVAIIDDEWFTVGSANLNNRGLVTDGEMNAVVRDPALARRMRIDLWAEHLALPTDEISPTDPIDLADHAWRQRAAENAEIIRRGERPLTCAVHSYTVGHKPSDLILEDIQSLTFEH